MTKFFSVSDNSFDIEGFPWITTTITGARKGPECPECHGFFYEPDDDITIIPVLLDLNKGNRWPDVLGSGDEPLFIVSERVLDAWRSENIGDFPVTPVRIFESLPPGLEGKSPPLYYSLQGEKMFGAQVDFEASGFVDVRFCSTCGRRSDNVSATYDRRHSAPWSYVFVERSWNGANLFTTDISSAFFFCTEAIVDCARKYRLTNFRFVPVEEGNAPGSPGIEYMKDQG